MPGFRRSSDSSTESESSVELLEINNKHIAGIELKEVLELLNQGRKAALAVTEDGGRAAEQLSIHGSETAKVLAPQHAGAWFHWFRSADDQPAAPAATPCQTTA